MRYLMIIYFTTVLNSSLLDFNYIKKAHDAYDKEEYKVASNNFSKIDNDYARYNQANALYKNKQYQKALDLYSKISNEKIKYKKLHNMGNCYAKLKQNDKAIQSYKDALKLKDDKDTKHNMKLLKKQNKQKKKQDKKQKKDSDKQGKNKKKAEQNKNKENKGKTKQPQKSNMPISNMEERKWQNMLNNRGVKTLMLPIKKGKQSNESNNW